MKLTLWQQFSSNHSANYVIVGVFDSVEAAREAGAKIRQHVVDIAEWSDQFKGDRWQLSPIEENLAREYHFDWKQAVDWLHAFPHFYRPPYQREPQEHVTHFDRLVFIDAPAASSTWQTGHQFANLMFAMGAQVYSDIYMGEDPDDGHDVFKNIDLDIQCTAPTVDAAINLQSQLQIQKWDPIPWTIFHPRFAVFTSALSLHNWTEAEQIWLRDQRSWHEFIEANKSTDPEWQKKYSNYITQDKLVVNLIWTLRYDTDLGPTKISRHDRVLKLKIEAVGNKIDTLIPALIHWMSLQGCIVDYQLHQIGEN